MNISLEINWVCLPCIIPLCRDVFAIHSESDSVDRASIVYRPLQIYSPSFSTLYAHIIWVQSVVSSYTMFSNADNVEMTSIVHRSLQGSSPLISTLHAHINWAQQVVSRHNISAKRIVGRGQALYRGFFKVCRV